MTVRKGASADAPIDTIRETPGDRPPRDPRNLWRVLAANGWSREVASEGNAQDKAAGYDRGCPARECPHRVQHWNGETWVDVARKTEPPQTPQWRVVQERGEYDLELVLANPQREGTDDDVRLVVRWGEVDDEPEVTAVYPCRECGWAKACGLGCHS
jgi:hypothetical protein